MRGTPSFAHDSENFLHSGKQAKSSFAGGRLPLTVQPP
jgi:hypothetical protein